MLKNQETCNKNNSDDNNIRIIRAKSNIYKQASLAVLALVVTIVLVFAMTVAWYSNVIHTENLVFETSSWDFEFEGTFDIATQYEDIAPGDSGIVSLELKNNSAESIDVLVNVTKDTESAGEEMKKRIYFYVDTAQLINGEYVEGIYVNGTDTYTYSLMPSNSLVLTEDYHSDPYLKWEWVYDVLGYYVTGKLEDNGSMTVYDYMRPVKYDLDNALFDEEGNLLTVNNVSVNEFLTDLFATDGYEGRQVTVAQHGYYPVVIDEETNTGIWLYLCNQEEIDEATKWDTAIADSASQGQTITFSPKILLTGQQPEEAKVQVSSESDIADALSNNGVDRIVLSKDIILSETLTLAEGREVVLDLNNNTLTIEGDNGVTAVEGTSITIINGTVAGGDNTTVVTATGATVTLSNTEITGYMAVEVTDIDGTGIDSYVKISGCTIDTGDVSVMLRGNAEASGTNSQLLVENSTINSGYIGIMGNGSSWGTDVEITGSTVTGYWAGIYQPQDNSNLIVNNSTIEGYTAIAIKGGNTDIINSTILGTGAKGTPAFSKSGYSDTGDAVYIETNYEIDINVNISGEDTLVKSTYSQAIQVFEPDAPYVNINVTGGTFSTDVSNYLTDGYSVVKQADGNYVVGPASAGE